MSVILYALLYLYKGYWISCIFIHDLLGYLLHYEMVLVKIIEFKPLATENEIFFFVFFIFTGIFFFKLLTITSCVQKTEASGIFVVVVLLLIIFFFLSVVVPGV